MQKRTEIPLGDHYYKIFPGDFI